MDSGAVAIVGVRVRQGQSRLIYPVEAPGRGALRRQYGNCLVAPDLLHALLCRVGERCHVGQVHLMRERHNFDQTQAQASPGSLRFGTSTPHPPRAPPGCLLHVVGRRKPFLPAHARVPGTATSSRRPWQPVPPCPDFCLALEPGHARQGSCTGRSAFMRARTNER